MGEGATTQRISHDRRRRKGLLSQQRGDFLRALAVYDGIVDEYPGDLDVAHMRATCLYQLGALDAAARAFATLLATPARELPGFWTNLGLLLAATAADPWLPSVRTGPEAGRSSALAAGVAPPVPDARPTVSVVLPAFRHAQYVGAAIASVIAQVAPPLELIVIDDGSDDGTAAICRSALDGAPFPVRFLARENRGAAATINEGIELAAGEFIQLLNSDDRLPPQRLAAMLDALVANGADWGYARVAPIGADGLPLDHRANAHVDALQEAQDAALMSPTLGLGLLRANSAVSSGNLMFRKRLWRTVGGFRDYRYNHDWDFCLRAALHSEPVLVPHVLYEYRIHGRNTITERSDAPRAEQRMVMAAFIADAQGRDDWPNPVAPVLQRWPGEVLALLGATDALRHVPPEAIARALRPGGGA